MPGPATGVGDEAELGGHNDCQVLSGMDAAVFGLVIEDLPHLADRNYSLRTVRVYGFDLLPFCRWLRDEDVELARVTIAALLRLLAACQQAANAGFHGMPAVTASTRRSLDPHRQGISELCFKGGDDSSGVCFGTPVAAWHEDHAEMPRAARRNRVGVQRPVVAHVIGDDGSALSPCNGQDLGI